MKAEEEEGWIFNKLKRQKSWEVRGLKELKKGVKTVYLAAHKAECMEKAENVEIWTF